MNFQNWLWTLLFRLRIRKGYAVSIDHLLLWNIETGYYELKTDVAEFLIDYKNWRIVAIKDCNLLEILNFDDHCIVFDSERDALLIILRFDTSQPKKYIRTSRIDIQHLPLIDCFAQRCNRHVYFFYYRWNYYMYYLNRWIDKMKNIIF